MWLLKVKSKLFHRMKEKEVNKISTRVKTIIREQLFRKKR
jgi:hypothetical protein